MKHLKAVVLQSALAPPATLEELPNLAEWARTDLEAIVAGVWCSCNLKFVLQVLFGMLQPRPARGRKRKAAQALRPSRKRGRPKKSQASEWEAESEVESESGLETEHEEEGDEGPDEDLGGDQEVMAVLDSSLYVARSDYLVRIPPPLSTTTTPTTTTTTTRTTTSPPPTPQQIHNHLDWECPRSTTSPG